MLAIRVILACLRKADKEFNLINDNDKICIGISGGKDSMAMFYALHLYKKFSKTKFEIYPCIIDLGFDYFNPTAVSNFVEKMGYKLEVADGKTVYQILKIQQENQNTPNLPCSICSKMKKAIINKTAHELGCNKVAFAHHRDDAIETLFLNEIYGGRIATFSPKMYLSGEKITFIRPLVLAKEVDLERLCEEEHIPVSPSDCPNDKFTQRQEIKNILLDIYSKYPSSVENFYNMLINHDKQDIFYSHQEFQLEGSPYYYKKIIEIDDFIDELKFAKKTSFSSNDKLSIHVDLFNKNKKIIGYITIKEYKKPRSYIINSYKYSNENAFERFIEEIINKLYLEKNPCILFIKAKQIDRNSLLKNGFILEKDNLFKLIIKTPFILKK